MNSLPTLSFVIPAFNEAEGIERTLRAVQQHAADLGIEVLVVDNGSSDGTGALARASGARVIDCPQGTIAAVRNQGVKASQAPLIVFIDADVRLSAEWRASIEEVITSLRGEPLQVLGSRCTTDGGAHFLNRYWFDRLKTTTDSYVNSGHLITSRLLFDTIGGFDEIRATAEDFDFCQRALATGATVRNVPSLVVVHEGYPVSIAGFIRRECWHGADDVKDWASFRVSRVAWLALIQLLSMAALLTLVVWSGWLWLVPIYLIGAWVAAVLLCRWKFGAASWWLQGGSALVFHLYLFGRALALPRHWVCRTRHH